MRPGQTFPTIGIISRPRRSKPRCCCSAIAEWLEAAAYKLLLTKRLLTVCRTVRKVSLAQRVRRLATSARAWGDGTMLAAARLPPRAGFPSCPSIWAFWLPYQLHSGRAAPGLDTRWRAVFR